jgi:hypothetical protein
VNADRSNACRNTADHPAETDGETSIDPSAAIAARCTMVDFRPAASAAAEGIAVLHGVLRDSSSFRGGPTQKRVRSKNSARSASWTCRRGCDRDLSSMPPARPLGAPLGRVFAKNSHLAAPAGCQNGVGKTPRTNRVGQMTQPKCNRTFRTALNSSATTGAGRAVAKTKKSAVDRSRRRGKSRVIGPFTENPPNLRGARSLRIDHF